MILFLAPMLVGCTIEQTPQEYIDHLTPPGAELEASRDELTVRLLSTAPALERGDRSSLSGALAPIPEVHVVGVGAGEALETPQALLDTLVSMAGSSGVDVTDAVVTVAPGNSVAWFRVEYDLAAGAEGSYPIRFSGVFVRTDGNWRLAQGHLSRSLSSLPANPDSAGTPAGGG